MKISEMVKAMNHIIEKHGDMEVAAFVGDVAVKKMTLLDEDGYVWKPDSETPPHVLFLE